MEATKKISFQSPLDEWIPILKSMYLEDPLMVKLGIVDGNSLIGILKPEQSKFGQARIWNLVCLEIWLRRYERFFNFNPSDLSKERPFN